MRMFLICLFLISQTCLARIVLNSSVIHRKGIDKGLILLSELHSKNEVFSGQKIMLKLNSGLKVFLDANYKEDFSNYGPNAKIVINAKVEDQYGDEMKSQKDESVIIDIASQGSFQFKKGEGQLVEIFISPEVK